MRIRIGVVVAGVAALVGLAAGRGLLGPAAEQISPANVAPGPPPTAGLPGPTAWEEGGPSGVGLPLEPSFRQKRLPPRPRAAAPVQKDPMPAPPAGPVSSDPQVLPDIPPEGGQTGGEPFHAAPQAAETTPAPDQAPGPRPVLKPPVLLTPAVPYPGEANTVTLDRSMLTPQMHVTAAQGRVILRILVRPDGTVASVRVAEGSGHPALDAAAVEAASRWRFEAATRDGEPIEAWVLLPVRFVVP